MYKKEYVQTFLEKQGQLFDEPVAEDGMGADVEGISLKELEEESEVFKLPDGKYMIVEG